MLTTPRTIWTMGMVVMFLIGISGCGQKHLNVSTSSGKANKQEEIEASLMDTPSAQTGIQDSSLSESGLGSASASQSSTDEEPVMVGALPLASGSGEGAEEILETPETAAESPEGIQSQPHSGSAEENQSPSTMQTAMDTGVEPPGSEDETALVPSFGSPGDEEFDALGQGTNGHGDLMESPHVERVPENIVIAKVEPSSAIEEQLARIKEDELATATAAGLQDVFFEFDSWKITAEGKGVLEKNANMLQKDTDMNLLIEGHCDQRGTQAYNIVLGKKRAMAIQEYLVQLGIEPSRLTVITYGKEKPFCTDETEFCYQENRRGHFIGQNP